MEKVFYFAALLAVAVIFAGCNYKTGVTGDAGIPAHVSHIEFWNGGTRIGEYDNADVAIKIDTARKLVGSDISFYKYEVTVNGETDIIVDSEALSIRYRK
jgi:hypothetical protein